MASGVESISCSRCGREAATTDRPTKLPEGWTGSLYDPVCAGCELVGWHPHCTSPVDADGQRVDIASIPPEEWDSSLVMRCEYIDLNVSWVDEADWPKKWRCSECGGTEFEGVHRDYQASGLGGASFTVELKEDSDG